MENVALVSKVEQLLNDPKVSSYTLQKNSTITTFQPVETKEAKKEVPKPEVQKQEVPKPEPVVAPPVALAPTPVEAPKPKVEEKPIIAVAPTKEEKVAETPAPVEPVVEKKVESTTSGVIFPAGEPSTVPETKPTTTEKKAESAPTPATEEGKDQKRPFEKSENRGDRPERPYKNKYRERG